MVLVGPCIEGRIEAADDDAAAGAVGDRVRLGVPRQDQRRRETRACGSTVGGTDGESGGGGSTVGFGGELVRPVRRYVVEEWT
jgi:hypothetical protein